MDAHPASDSAGAAAAALSPTRCTVYRRTATAAGVPVDLQLHIFEPPGHRATDRRAAIVFFFGGGWNRGTPTQFYPQCRHLADRGMVAMSADYRVAERHGTSPRECVSDGFSALRWIRDHAGELGIDAARIAAGGGSAGGQVAAATATLTGDGDGPPARPAALVLFNPVFDNGPGGYAHARVAAYWRDFSPLHNLAPGIAPSIVLLGTADHLVPVSAAESWRDHVRALGGRCELRLYDGQPHGFYNAKHPEMFRLTTAEMDAFLASLGFTAG